MATSYETGFEIAVRDGREETSHDLIVGRFVDCVCCHFEHPKVEVGDRTI
jgi:hypothetical protein